MTGYKIVVTDSLGWSDHYTTDTTSLKPTLRALVSYHVRITAQNNAGESPPLTAYIPAIRPLAPGRPANFRYQQAPFFPVTLHWDKPTGNISWYKIMLRGPGGGEWDFQTPEPKLSTYLIPNARYEVRIIAHNDISGSPPLFAELTTL
ncbi:Fibronectin type III domain protein [compost metagenome]